MRKTSSLKSFWPSERDWGCGPQQPLHCSNLVPSVSYAVKRSCSGILQLPRLSCRSSTQPDQENFISKAPTKVTFCLGASDDTILDNEQKHWHRIPQIGKGGTATCAEYIYTVQMVPDSEAVAEALQCFG
ncbi:hypothetical protein SRHO_G00210040 [Serrasalmus rhombeus]